MNLQLEQNELKITPVSEDSIRVDGLSNFKIRQIFDCGQCFRFDPAENPIHKVEFEGVAHGRYVKFAQDSHDSMIIYNSTVDDFNNIWKHYLALDEDYSAIRTDIMERFTAAAGGHDTVMEKAMEYGDGIRILRQDPWEAVCSFIVSQNNNIPRIKKIISAMCEAYGAPIHYGGKVYYTFPTAQALADAGESSIFALRTGFRAKYIYDAAVKAASGELDFDTIFAADPDLAEELLCSVKGIGPKVAACAMLFGFGKTEAFPIDVWIKRVIAKYYPAGLDISALGKYAGVAQQYLFYYERYNGGI